MKKYLPVILIALGIIVFAVSIFVFLKKNKSGQAVEEEVVAEIPFDQKPVATLTPSSDGHWLTLNVSKIIFPGVFTMDYELLYNLSDGRVQGVPGSVLIEGEDGFERELLLGSESSGKFRYDEGVLGGTLTLRLRDEKGKLMGKETGEFVLISNSSTLASSDSSFKFELDEEVDGYFVVMTTFGVPDGLAKSVTGVPYGVFSSEKTSGGTFELSGANYNLWDGQEWISLEDSSSEDLGIFVSTSD